MAPRYTVFFDGLCGFCDVSVQWLLDHDREKKLLFAPLQGEAAQLMKARHPELPADLDSLILLEEDDAGEQLYWHSSAAFGIAAQLPFPWRWLAILAYLPRSFTDWGYRTFAKIRYHVWGRKEACRIPSPEERARFLA